MKKGLCLTPPNGELVWSYNTTKESIELMDFDGEKRLIDEYKPSELLNCFMEGEWGVVKVDDLTLDEDNEEHREWFSFRVDTPSTLRRGVTGPNVQELQQALTEVGFRTPPDGDFGPATERAVMAFQRSEGLIADGIVGDKTYEALKIALTNEHILEKEGPNGKRVHNVINRLTQHHIQSASDYLGVELAAIMAVSEIESRGSGFFQVGSPAILFERHIMRRRLLKYQLNPSPYIQRYPNLVNTVMGGYQGGMREYDRLERAKDIHKEAALESCSWGCYQIMGFHWQYLGYENIHDFVNRMMKGEDEHLKAFCLFIEKDRRLHNALKQKEWTTFARIYNGPAFSKNQYDIKMRDAYNRFKRLGY